MDDPIKATWVTSLQDGNLQVLQKLNKSFETILPITTELNQQVSEVWEIQLCFFPKEIYWKYGKQQYEGEIYKKIREKSSLRKSADFFQIISLKTLPHTKIPIDV